MRRLLTYLRPYKLQTTLSALSIIFKAGSDVMGPYLVQSRVDTYMSDTPPAKLSWLARHLSPAPMTGITQIGLLYLGALLVNLSSRIPSNIHDAVDRPEDHVRHAQPDLPPPAAHVAAFFDATPSASW